MNTMIIRGTTPTIEFRFSEVDVADIVTAYLVIKQPNRIMLKKGIEDAEKTETSVKWRLTQEDTFKLVCGGNALIVCDWKLINGTRGRSQTLPVTIGEAGLNEVI